MKALRYQAAALIKEADAEELVSNRCQEQSTFSEDKGILSAVSELSVAGESRIHISQHHGAASSWGIGGFQPQKGK